MAPPTQPLHLFLLLLFLISAVHCYNAHYVHRPITRRSVPAYRHSRLSKPSPNAYYSGRRRALVHPGVPAENGTKKSHPNSSPKSNSTSNATAPAPTPAVHAHHNRKKHVRNWIIGFVVGSLAGVVSGFLISFLFRWALNYIRGRYRNRSGPAIYCPKLIKKAEYLAFLEKEEGLEALVVIGRGGCGEVYKAQLPTGNEREETKYIAIKKIKKLRLGEGNNAANLTEEESRLLDKWSRQIQSEIRTVGHIRHRNLLPLAAHVMRPECHYLVYEFMKNGSLRDALREAAEGREPLPWPARHRIAVGIAAGLEYLHVAHRPQIIHRDLKPANILLDDDMEARIADFGLAKAMPDEHTHVTSSNVAGTFGYIAPEYHQTLKFTAKCDIYSFGVILAVLVTSKEPSDQFFQETAEMNLVKWMRRVMASPNPSIPIDDSLKDSGFYQQMLLVMRIACFCTADDAKERPSAKDVRCMLSQIKY